MTLTRVLPKGLALLLSTVAMRLAAPQTQTRVTLSSERETIIELGGALITNERNPIAL